MHIASLVCQKHNWSHRTPPLTPPMFNKLLTYTHAQTHTHHTFGCQLRAVSPPCCDTVVTAFHSFFISFTLWRGAKAPCQVTNTVVASLQMRTDVMYAFDPTGIWLSRPRGSLFSLLVKFFQFWSFVKHILLPRHEFEKERKTNAKQN